ncbi:MAG: glycosyltransferase family protein [Methanoregula sp.]|uniref:cytidylyltransferase domain-containing protein n=1 Tax=Methanoregula sp. TaxID=2052170 RepID=UPI003C3D5502
MIVTIIQARMGSTRLPGKVMKNLAGKPVLWHIIHRVKRSAVSQMVLVATTTKPEDEIIQSACRTWGIPVFRGSTEDVLQRFCDAIRFLERGRSKTSYIIRITGDCPLIDPFIIDDVVHTALSKNYDYVSNTDPPTFPDGLDVEVISRAALFTASKKATLMSEHEHVTPYIRKSNEFRRCNITSRRDLSGLRWTLDNEEDYMFIKKIYDDLFRDSKDFTTQDVLNYLRNHPNLQKINEKIPRNEGYKKSLAHDTQMMRVQT